MRGVSGESSLHVEPGVRRFGEGDVPAIVAHRGASSTHPENTLPAFRAAIELGAPFVEFDVRLSSDGVPVVIHDATLDRTTDGSGLVHERSAAELRGVSAGTSAEPAWVPTLAEVLELTSGRCGVLIETKLPTGSAWTGGPTVQAVVSELERVVFDGPVLMISFDPRSIDLARGSGLDVSTGLLFGEYLAVGEALEHAIAHGHDVVLPGSRALDAGPPGSIERAHRAGVRVITWTVDQPEGIARYLRAGVDGVASNDPHPPGRYSRRGADHR
jgi:glycerophosphoryl diester phosphodiesterase